jgi:hypothetical protein
MEFFSIIAKKGEVFKWEKNVVFAERLQLLAIKSVIPNKEQEKSKNQIYIISR